MKSLKVTNLLFLFVFLFAFFCWAEKSWAADYYVSPTGTATWSNCGTPAKNGTAACSWQTAMANAVADDVVYFRGGTYDVDAACVNYETPAMRPANSGTAGHYITFIAHPGETPIVAPCVTISDATAFGASGRSYIIWDGFSGTMSSHPGGTGWLFLYVNSTGSIVRNCDFTGRYHSTYENNAPIWVWDSADIEIYNNYIHDVTGGVNSMAIWLFAATRTKIRNNTFEDCVNGIGQKDTQNIDNEIYQNFFFSTGANEFAVQLWEPASGGGGNKIYQNVFVNAKGIYLEGISGTSTINDYEIYNNTFYGVTSSIFLLNEYVRRTIVYNNIMSVTDDQFLMYYTGVAMPGYSDYNDFYGSGYWNLNFITDYYTIATWRSATGFDTNSITTAPGFINAGGSTALDYKRSSYPANGRGGSYSNVMGAYITGSECIGLESECTADIIAPAAPSGLSVQ